MSRCGCDQAGLRPVDEAIADLLAQVPPPPECLSVSLHHALGQTLAESILAPQPMPAWDNSAMDGYALRATDLPASGGYLPIAGRIAAGCAARNRLPAGHAVRIFTGAPLPEGADTVVAQEQAKPDGDRVWLASCQPGDHVRRRGEEFERGTKLLDAGQVIRPPEVGLLASLGIVEVSVRRPLRIGLMSSGDELREPGKSLEPGQIYNANQYSLLSALRGWGLEVREYGVLADDLDTSRYRLALAASQCDVLITSGGVSVGEEDHLKQAVQELGDLHLWRLAIQPGKPFAFGRVCGTPWIGLPGNPTAALLTLLVVARPFLLAAQGQRDLTPRVFPVAAGFTWSQVNPRRQYLRARLVADGSALKAMPVAQQGSAMLTGLCWAEGLAIVEANRTLDEGEPLDFLSFNELLG